MTVTNCQRCDGTGVYTGTRRDGSTYSGPCFACQGGGPRYRRSYTAARPALPEAARVAAVVAPTWNARQQGHLDAFAIAQPAAWGWLVANAPTSDFAASLRNGIARYGNLTPRQLACVERNLDRPAIVAPMVATAGMPSDSDIGFIDPIPTVDQGAPVAAVVAGMFAERAAGAASVGGPVTVNLDLVRQAMESARASGLRKVRLTFGEVTMKLSGPTFRSGAGLILCYFQGSYQGYVDAGNVFHARYGSTPNAAALDAFRAVGRNPRAAAETHGHETGNCACCRRLLTDPPSVMAGIGPVCIRRFGWGF